MQSTPHTTGHSHEPNDVSEAIARGLQKSTDHRDRTIASVERFIKWAYAFGLSIFTVVVYVAKIQWDVAQIKENVVLNKTEIKALHEQHEADKLAAQVQKSFNDSVTAQFTLVNKEFDKRAIAIDHVNEMWFMKEHGISNKEDFERKNGYPPPK